MKAFLIVTVLAACGSKSSTDSPGSAGSQQPGSAVTSGSASGGGRASGSGSAAGSATAGSAAPVSVVGTAYERVFVKGTTWTFTAEAKTTPPIDMGKPTTETKPNITCSVTDVHDMSGVKMATVACAAGENTAPTGNQPPAGLYAANADGLWWFDASDPKAHDKARAPNAKELLLPAVAAEHKVEGKSDDGAETWVYWSKKEGTAWCAYYTSAAGDEGGWGFCFDNTGMVRANNYQAGATTHETFYKRK